MKIAKIMVVMLIACVIQNVWSMESSEFFVERQFLEGNISPNDYLSFIASLSNNYAYKIKNLRNAQAIRSQNLYDFFLQQLNLMPPMAQQVLASGNIQKYKRMVESTRQGIMRTIDMLYQKLRQVAQPSTED